MADYRKAMASEASKNLKRKKGLLDPLINTYKWLVSPTSRTPGRSGQKNQNVQLRKLEKERY